MKEIQLIPSGDGSHASQARYHPRLGRNCLAESRPDCRLVLCDHLFLFVFIFFKEACAGGSLGRRGKLGSHTVVAACCLLGRNPIPKVGLQWGLCMHQLPCCKKISWLPSSPFTPALLLQLSFLRSISNQKPQHFQPGF